MTTERDQQLPDENARLRDQISKDSQHIALLEAKIDAHRILGAKTTRSTPSIALSNLSSYALRNIHYAFTQYKITTHARDSHWATSFIDGNFIVSR
jgi:hypothetical protein